MPIFQIVGTTLKKLNVRPLDKEKTLQQLVEANLVTQQRQGLYALPCAAE